MRLHKIGARQVGETFAKQTAVSPPALPSEKWASIVYLPLAKIGKISYFT